MMMRLAAWIAMLAVAGSCASLPGFGAPSVAPAEPTTDFPVAFNGDQLPEISAARGSPQEAKIRAMEFARAGKWQLALLAISEALRLDARWGEAHFLRAGILIEIAGADVAEESIARHDPAVHYGEAARILARAADDLEEYLVLVPGAADTVATRQVIENLRARASAAAEVQRSLEH